VAPREAYEFLGAFQVGEQAAVGEWSLDHAFAVKAGPWRAWLLAGDAFRDLVAGGQVAEAAAEQLLLVHADSQLPANELPPLTRVTEVPIHAASFTFACATLSAALADLDGFYDHLDGVHGPLANGRGVHVKLDGDGRAVVWMSGAADCVLVELT
jgi:hypothetical protein